MPPATAILRYPNDFINGPVIRPSDIPNAELMLMISVTSVPASFMSSILSRYIRPKFVNEGTRTIYIYGGFKENLLRLKIAITGYPDFNFT